MEADQRLDHVLAEMNWSCHCLSAPAGVCQASWKAVSVFDAERSQQRAQDMREALSLVELDLSREPLTLERLWSWQQVAVPQACLRTDAWAFAKAGSERYSLDNIGLDQRLQDLSQAEPLAASLRAYLDILFFHPFTDGNSRSARLAFHYFASRDGLQFHNLEPLFRLSIPAGSKKAYELFKGLACKLLIRSNS